MGQLASGGKFEKEEVRRRLKVGHGMSGGLEEIDSCVGGSLGDVERGELNLGEKEQQGRVSRWEGWE